MATKKSAEATRIEVRISVTDTPREIVLECDSSRDEVIASINESMATNSPLVLSDFRGRQVVSPQARSASSRLPLPVSAKLVLLPFKTVISGYLT